MVTPVHTCCGLTFRQPQSTVLMAYQPGGSGAPAFSPTVSPGCVTDPARAGAAVQSDRKAAVANFVSLLFMLAPLEVPWQRVRARHMTTRGSQSRQGLGNWPPGTRICRNRCGNVTLPSVALTTYKSDSISVGRPRGFRRFACKRIALWPQGHTPAAPVHANRAAM